MVDGRFISPVGGWDLDLQPVAVPLFVYSDIYFRFQTYQRIKVIFKHVFAFFVGRIPYLVDFVDVEECYSSVFFPMLIYDRPDLLAKAFQLMVDGLCSECVAPL